MGQKLKNLKVTSVDLCPQGANPDAYITLCKSAENPPGNTAEQESPPGGIHKLLSAIGKLFGKTEAEIDSVAKEAKLYSTVTEGFKSRRINDEVWDFVYALRESLESILNDPEASDRQAMMGQSVSQFSAAVMAAIPSWVNGNTVGKAGKKLSAERLKRLKQMREQLDALISETDTHTEESQDSTKKGVIEDMEFDRSKMTPEDAAAFDALAKKYAEAQKSDPVSPAATPQPAVADPAAKAVTLESPDIQKALEQIDALNKRIRLGEMGKVAEKYVPLGEKPDELAKTLVAMQDVGEDTYNAFVKRLDDSLALVEKSGIFKEIGSNRGGSGSDDPVAKIEAAAAELRKADPNLTHAQAFVKACENDPALAREYEKSR